MLFYQITSHHDDRPEVQVLMTSLQSKNKKCSYYSHQTVHNRQLSYSFWQQNSGTELPSSAQQKLQPTFYQIIATLKLLNFLGVFNMWVRSCSIALFTYDVMKKISKEIKHG